MKVTVYSAKGGQGKTPLSLNMALLNDWGLCTNEDLSDLDMHLDLGSRLIVVDPDQSFPTLPDDIEVVFDLGGALKGASQSVVSAVEQSDVVVVPIRYNDKSLGGGIKTILEVMPLNPNIVVIVNMIRKRSGDKSYLESFHYSQVTKALASANLGHIKCFPMKEASIFEDMYAHNVSIDKLLDEVDEEGNRYLLPITAYQYKEVVDQFMTIMNYLRENYGQ